MAAAGNGAVVTHGIECHEVELPDMYICFAYYSAEQITTTPAGSVLFEANGCTRISGTMFGEDGDTTIDDSVRSHFTWLFKEGEPQVISERNLYVFQASGVECEESTVHHLANGVVRQERASVDCRLI